VFSSYDTNASIDKSLMYEHDIIISAHGAAITHSIFVQKCTAVIQIYPEHYYPNKFFEPLIARFSANHDQHG
jgi:hypothetical protein